MTARTTDEIDIARTDGPITTLLVDDDRQWGQLMAERLEEHDDDFRVTQVLSANEAISKLRNDESIDCVVADYKMPEIDGLQFLKRVRKERRRLPFLLVTSHGSENIASDAISAGVTDYLIKNPKIEQVSLLANRIRSAVEQYWLQQAIIESEERYRTVTEQSWDAIVVVQDDCIVFCNRRLVEITGFGREELRGENYVESLVHPDDQDRTRDVMQALKNGVGDEELHEAKLATREGTTRHCEYVGQRISYRNEVALLLSIRDTTRQKTRERELEWERRLNRTVQTALIESQTRRELEQAIATQLWKYDYDLVWFGEPDDGGLEPRVIEGAQSYLENIDLTGDDAGEDGELSLWAFRSREPQFVKDFDSLFPTAWRETAVESGLSSGAAIPLEHNDIYYGVLAVYGSDTDRFDETERQLLVDLSDTVAFAIHNITVGNTLAASSGVLTTLQLDEGHYLLEVLHSDAAIRDAELTVYDTLQKDQERYLQYLTVDGVSAASFADIVRTHSAVRDATTLGSDRRSQLQVTLRERPPEANLATLGALVRESRIVADRARIEFELGGKKELRRIVDSFKTDYQGASVLSTIEKPEQDADFETLDSSSANLTQKQETALRTAYYHGYFEQPRDSSASEVADTLGVSHSTFLQHLRVAQRKIFEARFE